jgi:hypothetical protein
LSRKIFKIVAISLIAVVSTAWLFDLIFAPKSLYSISSSARSKDGATTLTVGELNPYPLSRECYRYVFIHPASAVLDTHDIQWEHLVAQFTCDGEVAATWLSSTQVQIVTSRVQNGSLPQASVAKSIDSSGLVRVTFSHGA